MTFMSNKTITSYGTPMHELFAVILKQPVRSTFKQILDSRQYFEYFWKNLFEICVRSRSLEKIM